MGDCSKEPLLGRRKSAGQKSLDGKMALEEVSDQKKTEVDERECTAAGGLTDRKGPVHSVI